MAGTGVRGLNEAMSALRLSSRTLGSRSVAAGAGLVSRSRRSMATETGFRPITTSSIESDVATQAIWNPGKDT